MLFKTGNIIPGELSTVAGTGLPAFQTRKVLRKYIWPVQKPPKLAVASFQKLTVQLLEICYPRGAKDLKSFQQTRSFWY
jgi:hypothetical protein